MVFHFSERFRRLFTEGFWIFTGHALAVLGSLAGVRLLTEFMDPNAYGDLALGVTVAMLVNQTVLGPLGNGISRFYPSAIEQSDFPNYLISVRRLIYRATGIIIIIIFMVISTLLIADRSHWIGIAIAAFFFAIFNGYNSILNGIYNAARYRSVVAFHQSFESWARIIFATGMLLIFSATSTSAMIGYALANFLILGSQYIFFNKLIQKRGTRSDKNQDWQTKIMQYSWPFITWGVFTWAQQVSDRWALAIFTTKQDVGFYAVLFQLGYFPISIAATMFIQFASPILFQRAGDGSDISQASELKFLVWKATVLALGVTIVCFLFSMMFHVEIFSIFVAKEYASISHLLPWVLLGGGVFAAGQSISLILMMQLRTQKMISAKIVTAILGIALNFIGAYWYGITGVAIAGIVFSVIFLVWMLLLSRATD